jgi:hypothetical protein
MGRFQAWHLSLPYAWDGVCSSSGGPSRLGSLRTSMVASLIRYEHCLKSMPHDAHTEKTKCAENGIRKAV